jgi:glycosyltransferase involved in cell wall biosynthesis
MLKTTKADQASNNLQKLFAIGCDVSALTGEGFLALSLIELLQSRFEVVVYSDPLIRLLRRHPLLRDRVLPLYIWLVCCVLRLLGQRVVLLNYVPIWNFLNALLARMGVRLAAMTGSVLMLPAKANWRMRLQRLHVQKLLMVLTIRLLPKHYLMWCATPSVYQALQQADVQPLYFAFAFLQSIQIQPPVIAEYDVFIYSSTHAIKNHAAVEAWLQESASSGLRVCYVGPALLKNYAHVQVCTRLDENAFNEMLARAALYLSFSHEDAGITGIKALAFGVPVVCAYQSGLAYVLDYSHVSCYTDPFNATDILNKVQQQVVLGRQREQSSAACQAVFLKHKNNFNKAAAAWLEAV